MKSKTVWIIVGVIVVLAIIYLVYQQSKATQGGMVLTPPMKRLIANITGTEPATEQTKCRDGCTEILVTTPSGTQRACNCGRSATGATIWESPQRTYLSCEPPYKLVSVPVNQGGGFACRAEGLPEKDPTVVVVSRVKSPEELYCERHGGTWNGTSCTAFTDINRTVNFNSYNPQFNGGGMNGNPAN